MCVFIWENVVWSCGLKRSWMVVVETWRSCCLFKKERKKERFGKELLRGGWGVKTFRGWDRLTRGMIRWWRVIGKRGGDCGVWCDVIGDCVMRQRLIILFVFDWWSTWHGGWAICEMREFFYDKFYTFYTFWHHIFTSCFLGYLDRCFLG